MSDDYEYPEGFFHWLKSNSHIWTAFSFQASRMAMTGRKRYSARTIVEVMRWNTELKDSSVTFKIQNNMIPGLARLWMKTWGETYPKFFEIRSH